VFKFLTRKNKKQRSSSRFQGFGDSRTLRVPGIKVSGYQDYDVSRDNGFGFSRNQDFNSFRVFEV
jgi:hypothetical protein